MHFTMHAPLVSVVSVIRMPAWQRLIALLVAELGVPSVTRFCHPQPGFELLANSLTHLGCREMSYSV